MSTEIISLPVGEKGAAPPLPEVTQEQRAFLEDFFQRMPITRAAKVTGISPKIIRRAIENGELEYIWFPGSARESVTPAMLAKWIQTYCVCRKPRLAS